MPSGPSCHPTLDSAPAPGHSAVPSAAALGGAGSGSGSGSPDGDGADDPPRDPAAPGGDGADDPPGDPPAAAAPSASSADTCLLCCEDISPGEKFVFGCGEQSHCVHAQCIVDYYARVPEPRCLICPAAAWTEDCGEAFRRIVSAGFVASEIPAERVHTDEVPRPAAPPNVFMFCCNASRESGWGPSPIYERVDSLGPGFVQGVNREEQVGRSRAALLDAAAGAMLGVAGGDAGGLGVDVCGAGAGADGLAPRLAAATRRPRLAAWGSRGVPTATMRSRRLPARTVLWTASAGSRGGFLAGAASVVAATFHSTA